MRDLQLSLEVQLHPDIADKPDPFIVGSLKLKGELHCPTDLNSGEELRVVVSDADGNVIAQAEAIAQQPSFRDIFEKDMCIGVERQNKATLS